MRFIPLTLLFALIVLVRADLTYPLYLTLPITYFDYQTFSEMGSAQESVVHATRVQNTEDGYAARAACDFDICTSHAKCGMSTYIGGETGLAADKLIYVAAEKANVPVLKSEGRSMKKLDYWYREHKFNRKIVANITLTRFGASGANPLYYYEAASNFHPLKGVEGTFKCPKGSNLKDPACMNDINSVFGSHFHGNIIYNPTNLGSKMKICSDDDSWLYIDKTKTIDYGGTRSPTCMEFELKEGVFVKGATYEIDFFHADRCPTQSSFTIRGTFTCETSFGSEVDSDGDGVPDCADACPDNPYKTYIKDDQRGRDCSCENSAKCLQCSDLSTSEALCTKGTNDSKMPWLECDWCTFSGTPSCVNKGTCACSTRQDASSCTSYKQQDNTENCEYCKNNNQAFASCTNPHECECAAYTKEDDCHKTTSYNCRWCNGFCVNKSDSRNPACDCEKIKTEAECFKIDPDTAGNNSCAWCEAGDGSSLGKCVVDTQSASDCPCSAYTIQEENKETFCTGSTVTTSTGQVKEPYTKCQHCGESNPTYCSVVGEKCDECGAKTTEDECSSTLSPLSPSGAEGDDRIFCNWCGATCKSERTCDDCKTRKNKNECNSGYQWPENGTKEHCQFCFDGVCRVEGSCPTCEAIDRAYYEESKLPELKDIFDNMDVLKTKCLQSVNNKDTCVFCGEINKGKRSEKEYKHCVNKGTDCPSCSDLGKMGKKDDFDYTAELKPKEPEIDAFGYPIIGPNINYDALELELRTSTCQELKFSYNYDLTPKPADHELTRCGLCEYSKECADLGVDIIQYNEQLKINATEGNAFTFDKFCDTDCHHYNTTELCGASKLNCSWCTLASGGQRCLAYGEICEACTDYSNENQCSLSGCTWCKVTGDCISNGSNCAPVAAVAAGIAAGIVAGIVIAAVVAVVIASVASKKMYDAIMDARAAQMETATSNPLFEENNTGGVNPVFDQN